MDLRLPVNLQYVQCQDNIFYALAPKLIQPVGAFSKNFCPGLTKLFLWQPANHRADQLLTRFQVLKRQLVCTFVNQTQQIVVGDFLCLVCAERQMIALRQCRSRIGAHAAQKPDESCVRRPRCGPVITPVPYVRRGFQSGRVRCSSCGVAPSCRHLAQRRGIGHRQPLILFRVQANALVQV